MATITHDMRYRLSLIRYVPSAIGIMKKQQQYHEKADGAFEKEKDTHPV